MGVLCMFLVVSGLLFVVDDAAVTVTRSAEVVKNVAGHTRSKTYKAMPAPSSKRTGTTSRKEPAKTSLTGILPSGNPVNRRGPKDSTSMKDKSPLERVVEAKVSKL